MLYSELSCLVLIDKLIELIKRWRHCIESFKATNIAQLIPMLHIYASVCTA